MWRSCRHEAEVCVFPPLTRMHAGNSVRCELRLLPCVERRGSGASRRQRSGAAVCSTNGTGRGTNMIRCCAGLHSFLLSVLLPLPLPLPFPFPFPFPLPLFFFGCSCRRYFFGTSTSLFTFRYCAFVSPLHRCARAEFKTSIEEQASNATAGSARGCTARAVTPIHISD